MQPIAQLSRHLFDTVTVEEVVQDLDSRYVFTALPVTENTISFFDTFDWRLYTKNILCFQTNRHFHLTDFADNELLPPLSLRTKPPRFWQEFPDSDIKEVLQPIIEMRALLLQATFSLTTQKLQILNRNKKIVAIITFSEMHCDNDEPYRSVHLREMRGYNKWFLKLSRFLEPYGNAQPDTMVHRLTTALAAAGRAPQDYNSALSLELTPEMAGITAVKTIYRTLLSTMHINLPGILDDLDSEFLHDLRVAIRRTRSALALIKDVLAPEVTARFKEEFRYLGQITGSVRDLDVYLLSEENYKARLPQYLQEGLHLFFQDLAKQRKQEQKKLVKTLTSPRCQTILDDWQEFLESEDDVLQAKQSNTPVFQLASKIISKRFKRVLRDGSAITDDSPDEALHRLRIQGKKLRYVLEFFSSLYPQQDMKALIRQLKLLQNNLGAFNDLSVQQDMLKYSLSLLKPGTIKTKKTSASIGGLLTALYHEHEEVRARFGESFTRFSDAKNIKLYNKLFQ
jgi:CHAD domain-containing protein